MTTLSRKVLSFEVPSVVGEDLGEIGVHLPKYYANKGSAKSFADPNYYIVKDITAEGILVRSPQGDKLLGSPQEFFSEFTKHKTNWISCTTLTMFLRWFDYKDIVKFYPPYNKALKWETYTLEGFPMLGRYKINNRYTINQVNPFLFNDYELSTLAHLEFAVSKLLETNKYMFLNPVSPSSTASRTLLSNVRGVEFDLMKQLPIDSLQLMYDCYYALRQDNLYVGNYSKLAVVDVVRAFLYQLLAQPSYALRYNIVSHVPKYVDGPYTRGWYDITATIPDGMENPPLPQRDKFSGCITYPTGTFRTRVPKPYIEVLESLGFNYTVHKAVHLIPTQRNIYHPYETYCAGMLGLLERQDEFYPVNLKSFYFVLIGHMIHMHDQVDEDGQLYYETSADFNPAVASTITGEVNCNVYRLMATAKNPYFFSADGGGAESFPNIPSNFKHLIGSGLSFNPGLKDKPGKVPSANIGILRDILYKSRDGKGLTFSLPILVTPANDTLHPELWGTKQSFRRKISWSWGYRLPVEVPNRNGDLLDRNFRSKSPYVLKTSPIFGDMIAKSDYAPLTLNQILSIERGECDK